MMLDVRKNNKRKIISYCDFCKKSKSPAILHKTGNKRYDIDLDEFGEEVVCDICLDKMR